MEIKLKNVDYNFHAAAVGTVHGFNSHGPQVGMHLVDMDGGELTIIMDDGLARDLINRLADALPPEVDHA